MSRAVRFAPLALFALIVAALIWRLVTPANNDVPSKLEGQALAPFSLPAALPNKSTLASADLADGKPHILNVFASWCVPCIGEVKVLQQLKARGISIEGVVVRDREEDIRQFLVVNGDPYDRIGSDPQSSLQIALGSSGVPESFIVDGKGVIRYQHIGPIEQGDVPEIMARLQAAR